MTASISRQQSLTMLRSRYHNEIEPIESKIERASYAGEFEVKVKPEEVSSACDTYLRYSGYNVYAGPSGMLIIGWWK